jgi:hypothetical protein
VCTSATSSPVPCGGRRTILADDPWKSLTRDVHDADAPRKLALVKTRGDALRDILNALGRPTEPPTLASARAP